MPRRSSTTLLNPSPAHHQGSSACQTRAGYALRFARCWDQAQRDRPTEERLHARERRECCVRTTHSKCDGRDRHVARMGRIPTYCVWDCEPPPGPPRSPSTVCSPHSCGSFTLGALQQTSRPRRAPSLATYSSDTEGGMQRIPATLRR